MIPSTLWVQFENGDSQKAETTGYSDISDFKTSVTKALAPSELDGTNTSRITLHLTSAAPALRPGLTLDELCSQQDFANTDLQPIKVKLIPVSAGLAASPVATAGYKIIPTEGPVLPQLHHCVPLERFLLLSQFVGAGQTVLLSGHYQSGKTSALKYIQRSFSGAFRTFYLDMHALHGQLQDLIQCPTKLFNFLGHKLCQSMEGIFLDIELANVDSFNRWVKKTFGRIILLLDEYDVFLNCCRQDASFMLLTNMNTIISSNRNELENSAIHSIVCAGTFLIVATQTLDSAIGMDIESDGMELEEDGLPHSKSDDSFDRAVKPFHIDSPWNKATTIYATPATRKEVKELCSVVFDDYGLTIGDVVVNDIWGSARGHLGLTMLMLSEVVKMAAASRSLNAEKWMTWRSHGMVRIAKEAPTIKSIIDRVDKVSKTVTSVRLFLERIVRCLYITSSEDDTMCQEITYLQTVGIINRESDQIFLSSPLLRDILLVHLFPPALIHPTFRIAKEPTDPPHQYLIDVILKALPFFEKRNIFDPLVLFSQGISEATVHAELLQILRGLLRWPGIKVLTETRVIENNTNQCDLWICNGHEYGIELKAEKDEVKLKDDKQLQQIIQYAQDREPQVLVLVNFVWKTKFTLPFKMPQIHSTRKTVFCALIVKMVYVPEGDLHFLYAKEGDLAWRELCTVN